MIYKKPFHFKFAEMPYKPFGKKLLGRLVSGIHLTFLNCEFEKGAIVESHQHKNEQISYVVRGVLKGTVAGKKYILKKGDAILIPPNTSHRWEALKKSVTLEVFSPINHKVIRKYGKKYD
ncbi:MAG TPA: cupin domain-containing protein [Rhabdochlamydiaceae bacterium]|nr:cupin domain-containing protein [Rhabdochlamydiaceae bacterium]